ncbi:MAG: V-type ATP synthase subunit I, partial [Candidatus Omnitrophica bacterium]|nr:V-type ATP synthase subunit I [Candidatus Omnitrophota bacterium]
LVALIIVSYITSRKELLPAFYFLLTAAFISLMILKGMSQKGFFMKFFWAFYGAYNVIAGNLLGDVLSYSRLFGLGLTTAVLGLVVNEMVFMSKGIPFAGYIIAVLLFIFGHLANLGINLLGGYVHTSRLQYLEFFTKFFEGGGRPFSPLKEPRQYTYLKPE